MRDTERSESPADTPVGRPLTLFAAGFFVGLGYLWYTYPPLPPYIASLSSGGTTWAALLCVQVGAWVVVGTFSVETVVRTHRAVPFRTALPGIRQAGFVLAILSVLGVTLAVFVVFLSEEAVNYSGDLGIRRTIGGLGLPGAIVSYLILGIVAGSILLLHAALQHSCQNPLDTSIQIRQLNEFRNKLLLLLFDAMILVGLSSGSAVILNEARGQPLDSGYLWLHGGVYSALLGLLYLPAHFTLVKGATALGDRAVSTPALQAASPQTQLERRKAIADEIGVNLSGLPGWEAFIAIAMPVATSLLG